MQIIGAAGVPAGAVHDTLELQNDESFQKRGIMQTMHHPDGDWCARPGRCASTAGRPS